MIFDSSSLEKKINDSSTVLLYELPSGFAVISFDGVDLNIPMEDLWAYPPKNVRLEEFKKFEEKSTAIDLTNGVVGKDLSEMLTKFCCSGQKLLVGRAEYKRIIEEKLEITCQYDNIVEELIWGLENILHTLLPEETSEQKEYRPPRGEGLILFLDQYGFVVTEDSVTRCIVEKARLLYHLELHERQYLELLCNSIKKFIDVSPLTKSWSLLKFVTALKFLSYPEESYEIWPPHKILSAAEYEGVTSMRRQYRKMIKSEIDVCSVYRDVHVLYSERMNLLLELSSLMPMEPNRIIIWNGRFLGIADSTDLPTGSEVGKETITDVDSMLDSTENCAQVSAVMASELDLPETRQDVTCDNQSGYTDLEQFSGAQSMGKTERKNHMEVSGAKGVRVARNLENVEQPHTDGTSKETAQRTQETSANAIKAVENEVESRQNGQVSPPRLDKSNELDFAETRQDVTCDNQSGDSIYAEQTGTTQSMGETGEMIHTKEPGVKGLKVEQMQP